MDFTEATKDLDWDYGFDDGEIALSGVAIIRALDADGNVYLGYRTTNDLRSWDVIGMLRSMLLGVEQRSADSFSDIEDDD